jgi:hypothetical protein
MGRGILAVMPRGLLFVLLTTFIFGGLACFATAQSPPPGPVYTALPPPPAYVPPQPNRVAANPLAPPPNTDWRDVFDAAAQQQAIQQGQMIAIIAQKKAADAEKLRITCEQTRSSRAASNQKITREYLAFIAKIRPHEKTIRETCEIRDTSGLRVETQRDGNGTIIRTRRVGDPLALICKNGVPKGLTEDDVRAALSAVYEKEWDDPLDKSTYENAQCAEQDRAVGLDLFIPRKEFERLKKLLAWASDGGSAAAGDGG